LSSLTLPSPHGEGFYAPSLGGNLRGWVDGIAHRIRIKN
jgi:hypothetical protein